MTMGLVFLGAIFSALLSASVTSPGNGIGFSDSAASSINPDAAATAAATGLTESAVDWAALASFSKPSLPPPPGKKSSALNTLNHVKYDVARTAETALCVKLPVFIRLRCLPTK